MDSPWAFRRRTIVTFTILMVLSVFLIVYVVIKTYAPPTCFDNDKNQDEAGVDCGGPCSLMCPFQTKQMEVEWVQLFKVGASSWTAVAYIQNTNYDAYTASARYRFTIYDSMGRAIDKREGTTFAGGEPAFAVVESRITSSADDPYRVSFEWLDKPVYYREERIKDVVVAGHTILPSAVGAEIRATLSNKQPVPAEDVEVVLIAYDAQENAIAASKTYVEYMAPRSTQAISFSWPNGFTVQPSRVEFIPRVPLDVPGAR